MIAAVRFSQRLLCGLACASALIAAPAALGATPPSAKDPCVNGTRDICNTTGVGYYKTYRYGTRWFGDFKNAIPGSAHTYSASTSASATPGPTIATRRTRAAA